MITAGWWLFDDMRWHHAVILKTSLSVHFFSLTLFVWFESSWKNLRFGGSLSFSPSFLVPSSCLDSGVGHQGMWPWNDIGNQGALDVCCNNCFCVVYPNKWRKVRCFLDLFGLEIGLESERFEDHGCGDRLEPEATQHDVNCMLSPVLPVCYSSWNISRKQRPAKTFEASTDALQHGQSDEYISKNLWSIPMETN